MTFKRYDWVVLCENISISYCINDRGHYQKINNNCLSVYYLITIVNHIHKLLYDRKGCFKIEYRGITGDVNFPSPPGQWSFILLFWRKNGYLMTPLLLDLGPIPHDMCHSPALNVAIKGVPWFSFGKGNFSKNWRKKMKCYHCSVNL